MKTVATLFLSFAALACASTPDAGSVSPRGLPLQDRTGAPETLRLTSPDFEDGAVLDAKFSFNGFGCTGGNEVPRLQWSGAPEGTKGYAVIVHDPDAPTGVGFFHWVLADIPASVTAIDGTVPAGATELHTDYGVAGYGGPCPPPGPAHRYVFSVYALDVATLGLEPGATGALARFVLRDHALAVGHLVGTFAR